METLKLIPQLACVAIFTLTLISLFGRYPFLELSTHFRIQYVWISIICLIYFLLFGFWSLAFVAFTSILVNGFSILPYYYSSVRKEKTASGINLKIMLANVEYRNKHYDKLIDSVKLANPDILILQELTEKWWENIDSLRVNYPYIVVEPQERGSGLALLSRYPIESSKILNRGEPIRPSAFCKINLNGVILSILTIHPPTPMSRTKFAKRNKNFTQSAKIIKEAEKPKLLIGDLNTTMWSPYFSDLVKASGLLDARIGKGLKTSWISFFPALFRIPIDHCLVGESIKVESVEIGDSTGSDHLPLIVNLSVQRITCK